MIVRELFVKVGALLDSPSFRAAQQAAEQTKQALRGVQGQSQSASGAFARVSQVVRGVRQDFAGLAEVIEKHRMVWAGLSLAVGAFAYKSVQAAVAVENVEHQLRRIAGTEENFAKIQQAIAQVRQEAGAFTTRELLASVRRAADETGLAIEKLIDLLPAVGKIAAAQGESIEEEFLQLRTVAATGQIRASLASIIGVDTVARLKAQFRDIDAEAQKLNISLEEVTERKFDLLVQEVKRAAQNITEPVSASQRAFTDFREAMDSIVVTIGRHVLPVVTNLTRFITGMLQAFLQIPGVSQVAATALMGLAGAVAALSAIAGISRLFRAFSSVALGLGGTVQNLALRVAMLLEAFGATRAAQALLSALIALQNPVASLRTAFMGLGTKLQAVWTALMTVSGAATGASRALSAVAFAAAAGRGALVALAAAGRSLLALLGPIAVVSAATTGLIWLIEKLWDKLSGKEHAKKAAKAFRERAVAILEKSQQEITTRLQALSEEQRRQIEEAFTKLPVELQLAAQELGAEEFVKLNINAEPIRALVSEIRKGRIEGEKLVTELSKIIGKSKEVIGIAQAQKETLSAVVEQYRRGLIEVDKSKIVFDRAVHERVLKTLRELQVPDVFWKAYGNLSTEMAALVQQRFVREGTGWIKELAEKMRAEKPTLRKAIEELMQAVAEYIPQSPAKRGPLSRIHKVGAAFASTVARSLVQARPAIDAALRKTIPEVHTVAVSLSPELEAIPEAVQQVRRIVQPVKGVPARLVQTVRRVIDEVPELSSRVVQRVVRIADEVPELPEAVQRVRRVLENVLGFPIPTPLQKVRESLSVPRLAPAPAFAGVPPMTFVFSPTIPVNVTVAPGQGWSERELATEIATQTGYRIWQSVKPHFEESMLRIFRSFKRHEASDIKGQRP